MRASPALVPTPTSYEAEDTSVAEAIRALVSLIEKVGAEAFDGLAERTSENVLIDTEVNGARYLLVRMPQSPGSRIQLSPREQEIVRMVAKGHPNKVIADVLNISSWTVCTHLRRIFAKLGVGSRAAMVARLLEVGILTSGHRS
jgi:two-component system nitrate/nitrite response regulator NarL